MTNPEEEFTIEEVEDVSELDAQETGEDEPWEDVPVDDDYLVGSEPSDPEVEE